MEPSAPAPSAPSECARPATEFLKTLLRKTLRITVADGRIFIGMFAGTDKPLNLIIANSQEYRLGSGENPQGRSVGQILIPWKVVVKIEAETRYRKNDSNGSREGYL